MTRRWIITLGVLAAVVAAGFVVLYFVTEEPPDVPSSDTPSQAVADSATQPSHVTRSSDQREQDGGKVLLGDIGKVPTAELIDVLSHQSPAAVAAILEDLQKMSPSDARNGKITAFFRAWVVADPASASKAAAQFPDLGARNTAVQAMIDGVDASAAGIVAEALVKLPKDAVTDQAGALSKDLLRWSLADPAAAARMLDRSDVHDVLGTSAPVPASNTWSNIAARFAAANPTAALQWAQNLQSSEQTGSAMMGVVRGWWETDPSAASAYVLAHLSDSGTSQLAAVVANSMALRDPQQASAWVNQLPNEKARGQAEMALISGASRNDPSSAARMLEAFPTETEQLRGLSFVVNSWFQKDPGATAQWIADLKGNVQDVAATDFRSLVQASPVPPAEKERLLGLLPHP